MLTPTLFVILGLYLLVLGADKFVSGAAGIARSLNISPLIIGLTIVGLATSMPEILVSIVAALEGKTEIAIGNAIGSNIANIGLVLGGTILCLPVMIRSETIRHEYILMCIAIAITLFLFLDGNLDRLDALVLVIVLASYTYWLIGIARRTKHTDPLNKEFKQEFAHAAPVRRSVFLLVIGLFLLLGGAELLVRGAVHIAKHFGISDLVIGLTIIAVGTSLPELAASIVSVIKKEADIAIGNIIGSNTFNMLVVLSIPVLIHPSGFDQAVLYRDFPVMIGLTLMMGAMAFVGRFNRIEGMTLLLCFAGYQYWLFNNISAQ